MGQRPEYYLILFRRTETGPMGEARRTDLESVIEWLRSNKGRLDFVMAMVMPGEMPDLPDKESIT